MKQEIKNKQEAIKALTIYSVLILQLLIPSDFPHLIWRCSCSTDNRLCLMQGIVRVWNCSSFIIFMGLFFFFLIVYNAALFKVFFRDNYSCCLCRLTYLLKGAGSLMRLIHTQKWIMFSYIQFDLKSSLFWETYYLWKHGTLILTTSMILNV